MLVWFFFLLLLALRGLVILVDGACDGELYIEFLGILIYVMSGVVCMHCIAELLPVDRSVGCVGWKVGSKQ